MRKPSLINVLSSSRIGDIKECLIKNISLHVGWVKLTRKQCANSNLYAFFLYEQADDEKDIFFKQRVDHERSPECRIVGEFAMRIRMVDALAERWATGRDKTIIGSVDTARKRARSLVTAAIRRSTYTVDTYTYIYINLHRVKERFIVTLSDNQAQNSRCSCCFCTFQTSPSTSKSFFLFYRTKY